MFLFHFQEFPRLHAHAHTSRRYKARLPVERLRAEVPHHPGDGPPLHQEQVADQGSRAHVSQAAGGN